MAILCHHVFRSTPPLPVTDRMLAIHCQISLGKRGKLNRVLKMNKMISKSIVVAGVENNNYYSTQACLI